MSDPTPTAGGAPGRLSTTWELLREQRPGAARVLGAVGQRPLALLVPVAVVTTAVSVQDLQPFDLGWFVEGGRVLTSADAWHVFEDAGLQMGPLYLLAVGLVVRLAEAVGVPVMGALGAVLALVLVVVADVVTRRWAALGGAPQLPARWAVGGALVGGGLISQVSTSGHQEELLLALVLAAAAAAAARGHGTRVGLLLALGAGIKVWAVLGGPLVLHGRRRRAAAAGAATACVVAAATYLPFLVWGEVRTFEFSWGIAGGSSLLATLGAGLGLDDWGLRCVQAFCAVLAGTLVALRRHGSALAVPVTVIAVRLLLEPVSSVYYVAPLVLLAVLWCWTAAARPGVGVRAAVLAAVPVSVLQYFVVGGTGSRVVEAALCLVVLAGVLGRERSARPLSAAAADGPAPATRVPAR